MKHKNKGKSQKPRSAGKERRKAKKETARNVGLEQGSGEREKNSSILLGVPERNTVWQDGMKMILSLAYPQSICSPDLKNESIQSKIAEEGASLA